MSGARGLVRRVGVQGLGPSESLTLGTRVAPVSGEEAWLTPIRQWGSSSSSRPSPEPPPRR